MRRTHLLFSVTAALLLTTTLTACGAASQASGVPLPRKAFDAAVAEVKSTGKPAYFLGTSLGDLPLTALDLVEENAPAFQVEADYGTCHAAGDGGCSAPVVVSTNDRRPDVEGTTCRRLEPHLGVPAGILFGELTLVTGDLVVTVSDFRDRGARDDVEPALRLLPRLMAVDATRPVGTLPPPDPPVAAWMDEVCGSTPGREVSHEIGGEQSPLDNFQVPDFTVERLGGGQLAWADYRRKPVVIAVGNVRQVAETVRRLRPLLAKGPSHATLLGLVTDPTGDKFKPRPVAALEKEAGALPVPVGYAAVPLSAVWFLDSASNRGVDVGLDGCVVAFVDESGAVEQFATPSTPDAQLTEWARALG
jgi:hypothetical protein